MANTIDPTSFLSNVQNQNQTQSTGSNTLGKDDFLKLLMTQLENQDPTSPMDDQQFISQMATFSTLEQITNMSTSINNLVNSQNQNQFLQASSLIGKEVTFLNDQNQETTATVKSVAFKNGATTFQLDDAANTSIDASQVTQIE